MTLYEVNLKIQKYENDLRYLKEQKEISFNSTQPKAVMVNDMSVQSSHRNKMYEQLDYSIDEIEPRIKDIQKKLKSLRQYVEGIYRILNNYEPVEKKIVLLREEKHMTWNKISQACNYSRRSCIYKYNKIMEGMKKI